MAAAGTGRSPLGVVLPDVYGRFHLPTHGGFMHPFGPRRTAAVQEQRPGRCAMCDSRMPTGKWAAIRKYTCGSDECQRAWRSLGFEDRNFRRSGAVPYVFRGGDRYAS